MAPQKDRNDNDQPHQEKSQSPSPIARNLTIKQTDSKVRSCQHDKKSKWRNNSKSAWALASPRFAGDTKYHEAMKNGAGHETMTPGRLDQRRRSTGTAINLKRPQTWLEPRRRYTYGHEGKKHVPTYEVTIPSGSPSFETKMNTPMKKRDISTTKSTLSSSIVSPPRRRRLEEDYFDTMPAASSLTDSNTATFSFPTAGSLSKSEERRLRSEQLAKERQTLWENQELESLTSLDSGIDSLLWGSPSPKMSKSQSDDDELVVDSFLSLDQTKSTCKSKDKLTIPNLLESVQTLERTVAKLKKDLEEKDSIIDKLNLTIEQRERNNILRKGIEDLVISKKLQVSNRFNVYSYNLDLDGDNDDHDDYCGHDKSSTVDISPLSPKNDSNKIKALNEIHQNEILKLKEIHRQDFLNLQDKTLKWIMSKSDQMQEQSKLLADMREELMTLKYNYSDLKATAKEAFVEAQKAISRNCNILSSYVEEELQESEYTANDIITGLKNELELARKEITQLKTSTSSTLVCNNSSGEPSSQLVQSWSVFVSKFRDALDGNFILGDSEESKVESAAIVKAESLFKELRFDDKQYNDKTCPTDIDVFQDSLEDENAIKAIYG